jgi:hypothetical protein
MVCKMPQMAERRYVEEFRQLAEIVLQKAINERKNESKQV